MSAPSNKLVSVVLLAILLTACGDSTAASDGPADAGTVTVADGASETSSSSSTTATTTTTATNNNITSSSAAVTEPSNDEEDAPEGQSIAVDGSDCVAAELPPDPVSSDGYRELELCGWQVFMNDQLFGDELAAEVYDALAEDLRTVIERVPQPAVGFLRNTPIWLELVEPAFPGAVYHPSAQWLAENGYPVKWQQGVQFGNARNYLDWSRQQPAMLLHEFAHAIHDQLYGFEQPDLNEAYDEAMQAGLYDLVEYVDGSSQPAYATTNATEYLAELSEAYFWTNDFYPFDREELAAHDPAGLAAVELIWQLG